MAVVQGAAGFIVIRLCIGFSLACFVCCQFWTSIMFSTNVVGSANAFAGGWGNTGAPPLPPHTSAAVVAGPEPPAAGAGRLAFNLP